MPRNNPHADQVIDVREPADVCVIGGGRAALVTATELVRHGVSVTLLLGGPQDTSGTPRFASLSREDLEPRSWVPNSGWPIDFDEPTPWLRRAHELASDDPSDERGASLISQLAASPLCSIETVSTVVGLAMEAGGVRAAHYRSGPSSGSIEARRFVLAAGAIENARLLLASDRGNGGIGNTFGTVGRYLMDHPRFTVGHIHLANRVAMSAVIDAVGSFNDAISSTLAEELAATRMIFSISRQANDRDIPTARASKSTAAIAQGVNHLRDRWLGAEHRSSAVLEVTVQCEQPPLIDSRVSLAYDTDTFGVPLPKVEWCIGEQVRTSVLIMQQRFAAHVEQSGLGSYVPRCGSFDQLGLPSGAGHHMGTTRMSHSPEKGVVNTNGRVHGVSNVYVTGGSVFPTSGVVDPTLTTMALATRLADHLAQTTPDVAASISRQRDALSH